MTRLFAQTAVIAAAYVIAGRLALLMAIPPGHATAVWPAAGIAVTAVLLVGHRACIGVALGSLLVNLGALLTSGGLTPLGSLAVAASIGIGAALHAGVSGSIIRRLVGYPTGLDNVRDIVLVVLLSGPMSAVVNATWSVTTLLIAGVIHGPIYLFSWFTWWVGDAIGVLIFTPLLLTFVGAPRDAWRRRRTTVALPLLVGFAVITAIFVRASVWEQARLESEFNRRAEYMANGLERRITQYIEVVESIAGLFHADADVTRDEFQAFTQASLTRHPGIHALSWNQRVIDPATPRDEHVVVKYIEPRAGNEAALGYDLTSEPHRDETFVHARETGEVRATPPLQLVQDRRSQAGLLVMVPVYDTIEPPPTPDKRRNGLRGLAVGVFRATQLVEESLGGLARTEMTVRVTDQGAPAAEARLYGSDPAASAASWGWTTALPVAGRTWQVAFSPTPAFIAAQRSWQAWIILASGLFFLGLLGILQLAITGREARVVEAANRLRRSEARTSAMLNSAFDAIVTMDHGGKIVEFNAAAEKMFGYRRDQVVDRALADALVPPTLREAHRRGLAQYQATGEAPLLGKTIEMTGLRADATEFPIELALTRVEGQEPPLFTAFVRDITERTRLRATEQQARADTARHARRLELLAQASNVFAQVALDFEAALAAVARVVAESVGDGCLIALLSADKQEVTRLVFHPPNPGAEEVLRHLVQPCRADDILGGQVVRTGEPMLLARTDVQALLASVGAEQRAFLAKFPFHSLLTVPLRAAGARTGLLAVARYQTEHPYTDEDQVLVQGLADRAALTIENARLFGEARAAIQVRDEFLSVASHELRTPLTSLYLQLETLGEALVTDQVTSERVTRKTALATRQTKRLGRLIDRLLDVSRLTSGLFVLHTEPVDLLELARETVEHFEAEANRARCHLQVDGVHVSGTWDRMRLEQVLSNLLDNAIKYAAGKTIEVAVDEPSPGIGRLSVRDRGPGIAAADVERIFGRFERAVSSRHYGGLGLGLFVSRQIVEAHGGSITVASQAHQGSTFTVTLPSAPA